MANWKNLDTLRAYDELLELWNEVDVKDVMSGASGAERKKSRSTWKRRTRFKSVV